MSNKKGAGTVINIIKCVGGGRWNDGLCIIERRERESNTKVLLVNLHITQSICVEGLNFIFCILILIWYQILPYLYPFSIIYCFLCNCNGHSIAYNPIIANNNSFFTLLFFTAVVMVLLGVFVLSYLRHYYYSR